MLKLQRPLSAQVSEVTIQIFLKIKIKKIFKIVTLIGNLLQQHPTPPPHQLQLPQVIYSIFFAISLNLNNFNNLQFFHLIF
jgi:hypothetical protein